MVSRRGFLRSIVSAPFVAGLTSDPARFIISGPAGPTAASASPLPLAPVQFPQPGFIRYDQHCFTVDDRDIFLFGAAFRYSRCARELWRDRLGKLKAAG